MQKNKDTLIEIGEDSYASKNKILFINRGQTDGWCMDGDYYIKISFIGEEDSYVRFHSWEERDLAYTSLINKLNNNEDEIKKTDKQDEVL